VQRTRRLKPARLSPPLCQAPFLPHTIVQWHGRKGATTQRFKIWNTWIITERHRGSTFLFCVEISPSSLSSPTSSKKVFTNSYQHPQLGGVPISKSVPGYKGQGCIRKYHRCPYPFVPAWIHGFAETPGRGSADHSRPARERIGRARAPSDIARRGCRWKNIVWSSNW
jgi:hypothetical protein